MKNLRNLSEWAWHKTCGLADRTKRSRKTKNERHEAFKIRVGMLGNAPSVGRVLLSDLVRLVDLGRQSPQFGTWRLTLVVGV